VNPFAAAARVLSRHPSRSREGTLLINGTTAYACRVEPTRPDEPVKFGHLQVGARNSGYRVVLYPIEGSPLPRKPAHGDDSLDRLVFDASTFRFLDVQVEPGGYYYTCDLAPAP